MSDFFLTPGSTHSIDIGNVISSYQGRLRLHVPTQLPSVTPPADLQRLQEQLAQTLDIVADLQKTVVDLEKTVIELQRPVIQYEAQF